MKSGLRNKTAEKRLKMGTFNLLVLLRTVPYSFHSFIRET